MMESKREILKTGTLLQLESGSIYRVKGEPIGYGGGSIIYPAERIVNRDGIEESDGFEYALKECYPVSNVHQYVRLESGEIAVGVKAEGTFDVKKDSEYLTYVKKMMLEESNVSRRIYQQSSRLLPIRESSMKVQISLSGEENALHKVDNAVTVMDSLSGKGRALASYVKEYKRFTPVQAFDIIRQVLLALREVHQAGYLHLDIQDGNIFVQGALEDSSTMVTLIDFGAARQLIDEKTAPITDKVLFTTEGFSAPEIVFHNDGRLQLGVETDIYAVGCLILYLLTGEKYSTQKLMNVKDGKYLTRFKLRKITCPKHLIERMQEIIARALQPEMEARYHSVNEMLKDVVEFLALLKPYRSEISATKYDAFVCYKHGEIDSEVAITLQRKLEHFHVTKGVSDKKKPFERVFVDEGELSSCADFGEQIREALKNARWLIVICSSDTPNSPWVKSEIDTFLEYHDRSHILAVLTEGEPELAFPPQLLGEESGEGQVLAADARGANKKEILQYIKKDGLLKLAAPMIGTTFDALKQRAKLYQLQRIAAVGAVILSVAVGFSIYAIQQNRKITAEYQKNLISQSRYLAEISGELLDSGDRTQATQVALEALPKSDKDNSRPMVGEAVAALNKAVGSYYKASFLEFIAKRSISTDASLEFHSKINLSPKENFQAVIDDVGTLYIYELKGDTLVKKVNAYELDQKAETERVYQATFISEEQIVVFLNNKFCCWDFQKEKIVWESPYHCKSLQFSLSTGKKEWEDVDVELYTSASNIKTVQVKDKLYFAASFATWESESYVFQVDTATGKIQKSIYMKGENSLLKSITAFAVSETGQHAIVGYSLMGQDDSADKSLYFIDMKQGTCREYPGVFQTEYIYDLKFLSENEVIAIESTIDQREASSSYVVQQIPYQISCYSFQDGKIKWKYNDTCPYQEDEVIFVNMEEKPAYRVLRTMQKYDEEGTKDTLIVQYGNKILYLNPENGKKYSSIEASHEIIHVYEYKADRQFILLKNGDIYQVVNANRLAQMGACNSKIRDAVYSEKRGEFIILYSEQNKIIVMSNQFEDKDYMKIDIDYQNGHGVEYFETEENIYRFVYDKDNQVRIYREWNGEVVATFTTGNNVDMSSLHLTEKDGKLILWDTIKTFENYAFERIEEDGTRQKYQFTEGIEVLGVKNGIYYIYYYGTLYKNEEDILYAFDLSKESLAPKKYSMGKPFSSVYSMRSSMSDDGKYLATFIQRDTEEGEHYDSNRKETLEIYSLEEEKWLDLGELSDIAYIDFIDEHLKFVPGGHELVVQNQDHLEYIDVDTMELKKIFPVQCYDKLQLGFLNDHIMVTINDQSLMETWNLMTGERIQQEQLEQEASNLHISQWNGRNDVKYFYVSGTYQFLRSRQKVFQYDDDGNFFKYLELTDGEPQLEMDEIICQSVSAGGMYVYKVHSFDELLDMANEITHGEELTDVQLKKYFINNN